MTFAMPANRRLSTGTQAGDNLIMDEVGAARCAMVHLMGKKARQEQKRAIVSPLQGELETKTAFYARKCGITMDEAARIIREARAPRLSTVRKGKGRYARGRFRQSLESCRGCGW